MRLRIEEVHKRFESVSALHGVDIDIASGELLALLGPSGSGKTTLLRAIAGLLPIDSGRICFGEVDATALSLSERRVGLVFQHYALFAHMTVADNIAFGLSSRPRRQRPSRAQIDHTVVQLLERMQLQGLGERLPDQLSGGQKQRVALARALAIEPSVLLLDEPFGALDAQVRVELRRWLRKVHDETGHTTVFVTHDQIEALELADRVAIFRDGKIEQVGTPAELEKAPRSPFVFGFIGPSSRLSGSCRAAQFVPDAGGPGVSMPEGCAVEGRAILMARPHQWRLTDPGGGIPARVAAQRLHAGRGVLEMRLAGQDAAVEVELDQAAFDEAPGIGSEVGLLPLNYRIFSDT
ncbi:MAG: sulfate/molybdate ABC transporter ATP-binding protein [Xanthomonadaceae bacterium]|nr:sulfate/molybdate ABC transporter ATP-binding protein [Xanthomonadaceae bacterium]